MREVDEVMMEGGRERQARERKRGREKERVVECSIGIGVKEIRERE